MAVSRKNIADIKEISVEDYFCQRVKALGGFTYKNNPNWYKGIGDRTFGLLGYMGMAEFKRPKNGRLSSSQKMWNKFLTDAGCHWHLISTYSEVDSLLFEVENGTYRACIRND